MPVSTLPQQHRSMITFINQDVAQYYMQQPSDWIAGARPTGADIRRAVLSAKRRTAAALTGGQKPP